MGKDNKHTSWGSGIDDRESVNFHQGHERNLCPCYRKGNIELITTSWGREINLLDQEIIKTIEKRYQIYPEK